ncbi:uncharacterized protein TRIADDRAFT_52993 [Trichoplax adhaerens]|uniref:F-box domain-containing protein n=1 Tax=Trichoplax adhaerens TaxID=10228 RepID=B3RN08_TRIAD|nr:hypothetical protein TRIADDRAFT_52993 [Trichoplax adhaerens]EDV27374.1 hypothetical protein TRIADDRAFT_52993 [Trichoplax adhaerens]|eukprot:XP_002109208.1 hypothetical protein TRIADDRAFT_52993 [Trichoplax adhaerens]
MPNPTPFSIANAPQLRCTTNKYDVTTCGECEACRLTQVLNKTKEWFTRCGEASQRRFTMGLMSRIDCKTTYERLLMLLTPLVGKDYTYTRSRSSPSLEIDYVSSPSDRALKKSFVINCINETWQWFTSAKEWTRINFLLSILQWCDTRLLHILNSQCKALHKWKTKEDVSPENSFHNDDSRSEYTVSSPRTPSPSSRSALIAKESRSSTVISSQLARPSTAISVRSDNSSCITEPVPIQTYGNWTDNNDNRNPKSYSSYSGKETNIPQCIQDSDNQYNNIEDFRDENLEEYISDDGQSSDEEISFPQYVINDTSGSCTYVDMIKRLPVHISKNILGMLDRVHLANCLCVSQHWRILVEQVQNDNMLQQQVWEEIMLMKGSSARGCNIRFASMTPVPVPQVVEGTHQVELTKESVNSPKHLHDIRNLRHAYNGVKTIDVVMDERNIFCDAYNLIVVSDQLDKHRIVHFGGGEYILVGSVDRRIKLLHAQNGKLVRVFHGHAGSIRALYMCEKEGYILSGSYDTTIRCWSLATGTFLKIFRGHQGTITCLDLHNNIPVSGARDKQVKVWNIFTGRCRRTFKHRHVISDVKIFDDTVASCCEGGRVKVWDVIKGKLIKSLKGHVGPVNCIKLDKYHLVSGGSDGYAFLWSAIGNYKGCLGAFRHPNAVTSVDFHYCRIITGSEDGKIRIWSIINGDCLRVMRGNSRSDPIFNLFAQDNRLITSTMRNVFNYTFEPVDWDYNATTAKFKVEILTVQHDNKPVERLAPSYIRVLRNRTFSTNNDRVHHDTVTPGKYGLHGRPLTANTLNPKSRPNSSCSSGISFSSRCVIQDKDTTNLKRPSTANVSSQVYGTKDRTLRPRSSPAKLYRKRQDQQDDDDNMTLNTCLSARSVRATSETQVETVKTFQKTTSKLRPSTAPVIRFADNIISDMYVEPRIIGRVKSANAALDRPQSSNINQMTKMVFKVGQPYSKDSNSDNDNNDSRQIKKHRTKSAHILHSSASVQSINIDKINSNNYLNLKTFEEELAYTKNLKKFNLAISKSKKKNQYISLD